MRWLAGLLATMIALCAFAGGVQAKPRTGKPAVSHRTHAASGAERRQTWRNTRADLKRRFKTLGHQVRRAKKK